MVRLRKKTQSHYITTTAYTCRFNWFNKGCGGKGSRNVTLFFARRLRWLQLVSDFLFGELTQEATAGPQGGNCLASYDTLSQPIFKMGRQVRKD
jgi:hypothetical protein